MNKCHKCGKPVYFAERKTSLGKEWHPSCLRCDQCEKVLTPGQHAERKGNPYCNQCYQALFGPQMFGYGSNVFSQANYRRKQAIPIKDKIRKDPPTLQKSGNVIAVTHSDTEDKNEEDVAEEIYETKRGERLEDVEEEEEEEGDEGDSFDCDTLKPRDNHCKFEGLTILSLPINNSDPSTMPPNNPLKNGHAPSAVNKEGPSLSLPAISLPLNYSNTLPADYRSLPAKTNTLPSSIENGSISSTNNHGDLSSSVISSSGSGSSLFSLSSQETLISPFMSTSQRIFGSLSSPLNLDTLTSPINYGTLAKIFGNGILPNQDVSPSLCHRPSDSF